MDLNVHIERSRRLKTARVPPVYPETPNNSTSLASGGGFAIRHVRSRRLQKAPLVMGGYPLNPPVAAVPAQILLQRAIRVERRRHLLVPLELNSHPPTPTSPAVVLYQPQPMRTRKTEQHEVVFRSLIYVTLTAATYPIVQIQAIRRHQKRRTQREIPLGAYPLPFTTPATPAQILLQKPAHTTRTQRVLQRFSELDRFTIPPPVVSMFTRPTFVYTRPTTRRLLVLVRLDQKTATPTSPAVLPAFTRAPEVVRTRQTVRRLLTVMPPDYFLPETLKVAVLSGMNAGPIYLAGRMQPAAYLESGMADQVVVLSAIENQTVYVEGDITDAVYVMGEFLE